MEPIDLIIVGGGPTGLAVAIEAQRAGLRYLVIEKGGITDAIRRFPVNMTFFSTPELLELGGLPFTTVNVRPTRVETLQYYRRVVDYFDLALQLHTRVRTIGPAACGFAVETDRGPFQARCVVVATGYFDFTNRLDVDGETLPHVRHYYDEPYAYARAKVAVIGGRNSAVEAALELYRHGADVTLIHRRSTVGDSVKYWIRPDIENRIREGSIATRLDSVVTRIESGRLQLRHTPTGESSWLAADFILALIGYRPDERLLRAAGVKLDNQTLIPQYDPDTFETNVPGLYIAGSVACGCETWNIFIENGRTHALPIIRDITENLRETVHV